KEWTGAGTVDSTSRCSMLTDSWMIASSLNSWPRAGTQQHASNAAVRRKTKGVRRCIMVHASVGGRRRAIRKMYMDGPHARHETLWRERNRPGTHCVRAAVL